ncbi:hypothetical protein JCM19992_18830 [Thermostilla marina]
MRRRSFLSAAMAAGVALSPVSSLVAEEPRRIPLGLDAHSMRAWKWKAPQLIDFAAECRLDAVSFNSLAFFESLEEDYLRQIRDRAASHGLKIYLSAGSICENGTSFSSKYGTARELAALGIRVATILGSPVVNVRIGKLADRYLEGGIRPRIESCIAVLKSLRSQALDAGIKFGFENHAGDLRSVEVLEVIEEVGADVCGFMLDPGNSLWTMEDPMQQLRMVGKYVVCTSVRDYMVWQTPDGAAFQWTAVGEGLMDVGAFVRTLADLAPGVPLFVESISNAPQSVPYLTQEYWKGFPEMRASEVVDFLKLCRRGHAIEVETPPAGVDKLTFDRESQRREFLKSIETLRKHGAGLKG